MLRVRRMFEVLLQMNERAGGLDQSFEIICIRRFGVEPKLFQNIVRFIVPAVRSSNEKTRGNTGVFPRLPGPGSHLPQSLRPTTVKSSRVCSSGALTCLRLRG